MAMNSLQPREIFTVARCGDGWAVEHAGEVSEPAATKEEARALAHRMARAAHDQGRPSQVTVADEAGFFAAGGLVAR
jgi:hypothetical protein